MSNLSLTPLAVRSLCLAVPLALAGCQEKFEMVTAALDSVSASEVPMVTETGTGTSGDASETAGPGTSTETPPTTTETPDPTVAPTTDPTSTTGTETTTTGIMTTTEATTVETTWDPNATTGAPVQCEGPEDCTSEESGTLPAFVLPFFRGQVCVADAVRPGDPIPLSVNPCVHPCIDPQKVGWRYLFRCEGGVGCEVAFSFYYREATGDQCPEGAFGKFDAAKCKYIGPHKAALEPIMQLGNEEDNLLLPFLTNEDAAAVSAMEAAAMVWMRIDGHAQADDRRFPLSVDAGNSAPPASCGPGVVGCTCRDVGL